MKLRHSAYVCLCLSHIYVSVFVCSFSNIRVLHIFCLLRNYLFVQIVSSISIDKLENVDLDLLFSMTQCLN